MTCPLGICDGEGNVWLDDRTVRRCACERDRELRRKVRRVSNALPRRLQSVEFDRNPVRTMPDAHVEPVRRYIDYLAANLDAGRGLWLAGDVGTGKTTLAALVAKHAARARFAVQFFPYVKLLNRIKSVFDDPEVTEEQMMDQLTSLDLLVIDDVGAEYRTEYALAQARYLIDERYSEQRATIITTNLPEAELAERLSESGVDRLYEVCGEPIVFSGPSHRRRHLRPASEEAEAA